MKKTLPLLAALLLSAGAHAQSAFSDDFESYTLGAYVGAASPNWTTWSGTTGGAEDAQVVNTAAASGMQSIYFNSSSANGGPQDVVLPFGGQYNTGTFVYDMNMKVAAGKGAYFNFQAQTTIGNQWAMDCAMNQNGDMYIYNTNGALLTATYPNDTWFNIRFEINLNANHWEVFIDNVSQGSFANSTNQIASIDIFPVNQSGNGGNGLSTFWVDDVSYTYTPYTLPAVNGAVVAAGAINPATRQPAAVTGIVGQNRSISATVRNLGQNAITSFDIGYSYNGNNANQSVTGVNIPSLGTYTVDFGTPATLIAGSNPLVVTVSNVNGAGADGDPSDDANTQNVNITAVPAAGKVVVGEEATGTWCQWCPRGAVFMDYMAESYDGYFAGVAVHNSDPMAIPQYDTPIGNFIGGYPSALVDRNPEIDPSGIENSFLTQITQAPAAVIANGATWDAQTRTLNVSLTYTFSAAASNNWRVACVLAEDSVTGTGAGWGQANAYGNNSNGPMGGFELLGTTVPAAQMNYNHVAREIMPNFDGFAGFPAVVSSGDIITFNFSFVLPAGWDPNQIHIIGMLMNPNGLIDNGSSTTIAEAVANGFVNGTVITAAAHPAQPDAQVSLYPNPVRGTAWLNLNLNTQTEVTVTLRDLSGRSLETRNLGLVSGAQMMPIHTQTLAQGMYLVEVRMGNEIRTEKLVVE